MRGRSVGVEDVDRVALGLSEGADLQLWQRGMMLALRYMQERRRDFVTVSRAVARELDVSPGELHRYLRSWYNAGRDLLIDSGAWPDDGMDAAARVEELFDAMDEVDFPRPAPILTFAWTPPGSEDFADMGAIALRSKPDTELTPEAYRDALAARINRMVARVPRTEARKMLNAVFQHEGMIVSDPDHVGEFLVRYSARLQECVCFPDWPVPASKLTHEPDTLEWLTSGRDNFYELMDKLYYM